MTKNKNCRPNKRSFKSKLNIICRTTGNPRENTQGQERGLHIEKTIRITSHVKSKIRSKKDLQIRDKM